MKQFIGLKKLTITFSLLPTLLFVSAAHASISFNNTCPEKFIATVTNIEDVESSTFPKVEVDFQIIQTLKGEKNLTKKIQVVKDGPVQFKSGEVYTVEVNDVWLCSATAFSKI